MLRKQGSKWTGRDWWNAKKTTPSNLWNSKAQKDTIHIPHCEQFWGDCNIVLTWWQILPVACCWVSVGYFILYHIEAQISSIMLFIFLHVFKIWLFVCGKTTFVTNCNDQKVRNLLLYLVIVIEQGSGLLTFSLDSVVGALNCEKCHTSSWCSAGL